MSQAAESSSLIRSAVSGVVLVGGGGHAKVVADAIRAIGASIAGFLDDRVDAPLVRAGVECLGPTDGSRSIADRAWIVAIGENTTREAVERRLLDASAADKGRLIAIIHPTAYLAPTAHVESGVFIAPRAVINPDATIRRGVIINTAAVIEHDNVIGEYAHIAPTATLGGEVTVGPRTLVGLGARVLPGVHLGAGCTIGAGAVVTRDIPDGATVVGVPARHPHRGQ